MKVFRIFLACLIFVIPSCYCANILVVVPTPSYSHQIAFTSLWKELSLRGHKVTVLTTDPQNDPKLTNLTEIDLNWTYQHISHMSTMLESSLNMWNILVQFSDAVKNITEAQLSYGPVQDLMKKEKNYDVVLVEFLFPEFLGFAEMYDCPKILIGSLDPNSFIHRLVGNPAHPIVNPDMFTPFYGNLNFKERIISMIYDLYVQLYAIKIYFNAKQSILSTYFNTKSTVEELINDVDMLFINTNPVLQSIRASGPSTVNIGGYERFTSKEPLPKSLEAFLNSAKEGFIYFSLGSNVKSKDLRKETLAAIMDALKAMPYKVLWKFEADILPGKPDNVKLIKWAPQKSVLAHPNIKLFVTQGGLQSLDEAIYNEVPLVVIPFFGDQEQNAKMVQSKGMAVIVEVRPYLDKDKLQTAMLEVTNSTKYYNAVKRLKQISLDTPMTGLEKAIWWIEYVIRNKGAKHLKNPAADLPSYQYYLIDVISFLFAVLIILIVTLLAIVRFLYRFIFSKILTKQLTANKKIN